LIVKAGVLITIALMLASIAQGSDYRVPCVQAKWLQRVNDVYMPGVN